MTETAAIDNSMLSLVTNGPRLRILAACSEGPQTVAALGPTSEARRHVERLISAGLIIKNGESCTAVSDWRPVVRAFEGLQERSRAGSRVGSKGTLGGG